MFLFNMGQLVFKDLLTCFGLYIDGIVPENEPEKGKRCSFRICFNKLNIILSLSKYL